MLQLIFFFFWRDINQVFGNNSGLSENQEKYTVPCQTMGKI